MTAPLATALPYGMRDCKLTEYEDGGGTVLGDTSVDLPNMQTLSFSEAEEFEELRGDDRVVTTRGSGAQVEWELEAGGISIRAWAIFTGGSIIEEGVAPNRRIILRKMSSDSRPFFRIQGQAISDSGGDFHSIIYRCRCNDAIEGEFADGEFFVTSVSGLGLPLLDEEFDLLYDLIHNETKTAIPVSPIGNPLGPPSGVTVGTIAATTVELDWNDQLAAESYRVEKSVNAGVSWTAVSSAQGGEPTDSETTVTTLTTATPYQFRVKSFKDGITSLPSAPVSVTTA